MHSVDPYKVQYILQHVFAVDRHLQGVTQTFKT
jgi:hypothetical protein